MAKKKTTKSKDKQDIIPFPEDGNFAEYLFWFISVKTKEFILILLVLLIGVIALSISVTPTKDVDGKTHYKIEKEAIKLKSKLK